MFMHFFKHLFDFFWAQEAIFIGIKFFKESVKFLFELAFFHALGKGHLFGLGSFDFHITYFHLFFFSRLAHPHFNIMINFLTIISN